MISILVCLCIRTYALYRRDRRILALVVGSGLVLLGLACVSALERTSRPIIDIADVFLRSSQSQDKNRVWT